jgi:hypothetical protein
MRAPAQDLVLQLTEFSTSTVVNMSSHDRYFRLFSGTGPLTREEQREELRRASPDSTLSDIEPDDISTQAIKPAPILESPDEKNGPGLLRRLG